MNEKIEIGIRLKKFANKFFGSIAALERKLGKPNAFFQNYINGRSYLGGEILRQLSDLGCDVNWLLTGKTFNDAVINERLSNLENTFMKDINDLKAQMYDLKIQNEKLVEESKEKDIKNAELEAKLLVRFALAGELEKKLKK